jgi:hypothetical protein
MPIRVNPADISHRTLSLSGSTVVDRDPHAADTPPVGLQTPEALLLACRAPSRRNPERFVCGAKLGEALEELRFMGVVRRWADRARATEAPRDVRRCPKCGWYNLYEPKEGT